jgi:hypothetical protein
VQKCALPKRGLVMADGLHPIGSLAWNPAAPTVMLHMMLGCGSAEWN